MTQPKSFTKGNDELMDMIRAYWAEKGFLVKLRTELVKLPHIPEGRTVIKSDMKNGFPKDAQVR